MDSANFKECKRLFWLLIAACLGATALATLGGWLSRWVLLGELASHFRVQYFWILVAGTLLLAASKQFKWAAMVSLFAVINLAAIAPLYWPSGQMPTTGPHLRTVLLNVHSSNRKHAEVLEFLRATDADCILLCEITDAWLPVIKQLQEDYPYSKLRPREDNFGIGFLSRRPLESVEVLMLGSAELPSIRATLKVDDQLVTIVGTHPLPPARTEGWQLRNEQLAAVAELVRNESGSVVLLGDLNVTSWSAFFDTLLDGTRLRDSREGFGIEPTWPNWFAIGRIPIDHCLISPEIAVTGRSVGPDVGSDHFPIVVDMALLEEAAPSDAVIAKHPLKTKD